MGLIHCNLRVLMAERGLNIQKVRDQTSLSRTTISNLVNNYGSGIQFDTLKQLCNLFDCQPGDLFTYIDVSIDFEVITENPIIKLNWDTSLDKKHKLSGIQLNLSVKSTLKHEGTIHEFTFDIDMNYEINEYEQIDVFKVGLSPEFNNILNQLKLLPFVKDFLKLELEDFLTSGGTVIYFSDDVEISFMEIISYYEIKK